MDIIMTCVSCDMTACTDGMASLFRVFAPVLWKTSGVLFAPMLRFKLRSLLSTLLALTFVH